MNNRTVKKGKKIFVHIGLPKTATSTLQTDVFPKLENESLLYIGVDGHRRNDKNDVLYNEIMSYVNGDDRGDYVVKQIKEYIEDKNIILSEEMLTVSTGTSSWTDKLIRLSKILSELDYELIVTVRDPRTAIFSYYVELYPRFIGVGYIESVKDEAFGIFRYEEFINVLLSNFKKNRIHIFKFEDIIHGKLDSLTCLLVAESESINFSINNRNARKKDRKLVVRQEKMSRLEHLNVFLFRSGLRAKIPVSLKSFVRPMYRKLYKLLEFYPEIPLPTKVEIEQIDNWTKKDRMFLKETFGVDYCE